MATSDESGTTITVTLKSGEEGPLTSPVPAAETREIRRHVLPRARVLIVDDDETTRFVLARFLEEAAAVAMASDGAEALVKAEALDPQVILVDAEMPGLDGFATAKKLRAQERELKRPRALIVGLSSHDDTGTRDRFVASGCDLALVKPVTRPAILAVVESALADRIAASSSQAQAPEVEIDQDLLALIPAFLESRREQSRDLVATLAAGERDHARAVAHKLRGGLEMCGFTDAAARSRDIEERLARGEAIEPISAKADDLRLYLERVRYRPRVGVPRKPSQEE